VARRDIVAIRNEAARRISQHLALFRKIEIHREIAL
jgi:hypothetical protein